MKYKVGDKVVIIGQELVGTVTRCYPESNMYYIEPDNIIFHNCSIFCAENRLRPYLEGFYYIDGEYRKSKI